MHARQAWWAVGVGALAAAVAGCGASGPATSGSALRSGRGAAVCQAAQLRVSLIKSGVATGHVGATLGFTNSGSAACTLTGWPEVTAVTAGGHAVAAAKTLTTFFGPAGVTAPPVVTVRPGARAEAELAGVDMPVHGAVCASFRTLRVVPPAEARARDMSAWVSGLGHYLPACGALRISPIVPASELP